MLRHVGQSDVEITCNGDHDVHSCGELCQMCDCGGEILCLFQTGDMVVPDSYTFEISDPYFDMDAEIERREKERLELLDLE
jgi:hypothetical protein